MITSNNFKKVLESLGGFSNKNDIYTKKFDEFDCELKVDFKKEKFEYPREIKFDGEFTLNFHQNESFVVFECVHNLLAKGYNPKHIELEKTFGKQKKEDGGGRADIIIKKNNNDILLIIECKTSGSEFDKYWKKTLQDGDQLFRYLTNKRETQFLCMYTSDFIDDKVVSNYNLISLIDNKEYIENNPNLESFKIAKTKNKEDIFKVWCETYGKEYSSQGIFEKEIAAYKIGKTKFTSKDLKNLNSKDIQGKYHEFATILRQHNVSGRENAFDKLVNLFLCKVTDEKENPDELKFYWKGKAYDNPFDFQDRLQKLYKQGMEKFLDDKITYIDNALIDEAFDVFKDKKNETKRLVKEYLKAQKFFTNNDFAFIDVHNESLFYQNFEVLLKIVRMIQDISLAGSDENQFLGDMFEGFLDQGVKQSEGQFFTPMPIVKFIINSLPNRKEPKVVDYACGAGHFLNEYASINEGSEIVGIEKEYRLSKVAKVSSFMYGSDMKIIYDDALKKTNKVEDNSFDVLIANPPYSVRGFLETLKDEDRNNYELINTIEEKSYGVNNAIECFFIERSKQLVKEDGVIGIIVPTSILNKGSQSISSNKGNIYVRTREIILKYFDIVAIAEFGSGTFGKTGTNTITLFLKRRSDNPPISNHLENMVDSWFECDFETNKAFEDDGLLEKYCNHIEVEFDVYKTLLCQNLNEKIFEHDTFKEYKIEFEKLSETKNRKKKKTYKALSIQDKEIIEKKELIKYIRTIEKDKFYYFCLAYKNSSDVVIVKSPSSSAEIKKFLGYDWSSKKGNEGIKYLSSGNVKVQDDTLDEEDKRILENLQGLKDIKTPLYNPNNIEDENKINKIIKDNFNGIKSNISEELNEFVTRSRLVDMLDFSRIDFSKVINLNPNKKLDIISKFPLERIEKLIIEN
ncbi:restriction endonuclease subunit M, partial [Aliarcobacter skirrowii]|uniref:restriction endonuclease subunit M n=1 Tax=Aliarcobacter skirrowii TaxID=28200 RepID=UPI0029AE212E